MTSFWPFLLLQLVIFIGLVLVLRRILSRNLTTATAHLQGLGAEYMRRHEELKERLGEAEQQYREQMTRATTEAERLIAQGRQEAESSRARLLEEARAESERIVQQGMESRDAIRKELEQRMVLRAIERACELIQEVLPGQLRQEIQSRWLDELIHNGLTQLNHMATQEVATEAKITSAFPLTPEQQGEIRRTLKEKLGRDVTITTHADAKLVAGLTITLGSLVLDGSLASKVRQAARHAQNIS